jgi:hypothetical protein
MKTVSGTLTLPADAPIGAAVRTALRVRDITLADLPLLVHATLLLGLPITPSGIVPFSFQIDDVAPNRLLNLEVHVDMDGSDNLTQGDLITTERVPVLVDGAEQDVSVPLTRIG